MVKDEKTECHSKCESDDARSTRALLYLKCGIYQNCQVPLILGEWYPEGKMLFSSMAIDIGLQLPHLCHSDTSLVIQLGLSKLREVNVIRKDMGGSWKVHCNSE
mgnify:CR=1 FL=1